MFRRAAQGLTVYLAEFDPTDQLAPNKLDPFTEDLNATTHIDTPDHRFTAQVRPNPFMHEPAPLPPIAVRLEQGGKRSLEVAHLSHLASIDNYGVGMYYGIKSRFAKMTPSKRREWIKRRLLSNISSEQIESRLHGSSCIDWALQHLKAAYLNAGLAPRWNEIMTQVEADDFRGTTLAKLLQADGWRALYFARDVKLLKADTPFARHAMRAVKKGVYHGIKIDEYILDYRPLPPAQKKGDPIKRLESVGFFFGLVKSGHHTFVGTGRKISELHWRANPNYRKAIEYKQLDSPRFVWSEGVLMLPPKRFKGRSAGSTR